MAGITPAEPPLTLPSPPLRGGEGQKIPVSYPTVEVSWQLRSRSSGYCFFVVPVVEPADSFAVLCLATILSLIWS
jgi:hypothetical protein